MVNGQTIFSKKPRIQTLSGSSIKKKYGTDIVVVSRQVQIRAIFSRAATTCCDCLRPILPNTIRGASFDYKKYYCQQCCVEQPSTEKVLTGRGEEKYFARHGQLGWLIEA